MQSHVDLQTALRGEHTVADMTAERFLARVNLHVRVQGALNREALVAVVALVRPLACMRANVSNKVARLAESFRTVLAFVHIFFRLFPLRVFLNDRTSLMSIQV